MNKPNRLVNAIIGCKDHYWYEDEFDLGLVDPGSTFDRSAAESRLRELIDECEFVFITFYKELYMQSETWEDSHGHKTPDKSVKKKIVVGKSKNLKKFLVFNGDTYYPYGGWDDFRASFDTEREATRYLACQSGYDWAHIIDSETGDIIFTTRDSFSEE